MNLKHLLNELTAAEKAHQRGLISAPFGKWKDKSGRVVARTVGGDLEDVAADDPGNADGPGADPAVNGSTTPPKPTGMSAKTAGTAPIKPPTATDTQQTNKLPDGDPKPKAAGAEGEAPLAATPNPHVPQRISKTMGKPVQQKDLQDMLVIDDNDIAITDEIIIGEELLLMNHDDFIKFWDEVDRPALREGDAAAADAKRQHQEWRINLSDSQHGELQTAQEEWQKEARSKSASAIFDKLGNLPNPPLINSKSPIYRGMHFNARDGKEFLSAIRVGQNLKMPASGFSAVGKVAAEFAKPHNSGFGVLMRLAPNKNGQIKGIHVSQTGARSNLYNLDSEAEIVRPHGPESRVIGVTKMLLPGGGGMRCTYVIDLEERMDEDEPTKEHIKESSEQQHSLFNTAMNSSVYNPPNAYSGNRKEPASAYNRANTRMNESKLRMEQILAENVTATQAHELGLHYVGWGWWADDTEARVARTVKGRLVKVEKDSPYQKEAPVHDSRVMTFTKNSDTPDELNGIPFTPWINAPETLEEWKNISGVNHEIEEPPFPEKSKLQHAPHVDTPSKLHQYDKPEKKKDPQQKSLWASLFNSDDDKHSFLNFRKKQQEKDAAKAKSSIPTSTSNSEKNYWDSNKKEYGQMSMLPMRKSAGCIIQEPDGRVWLVEPWNHFAEYEHTFPKGGIDQGLTAQETAIKEAFEETGLKVRIKKYVGDYESKIGNSMTRYYLAEREAGSPTEAGWETQAVKLVPLPLLRKFFNQDRDKQIATDIDTPYKGTGINEGVLLTESAASDQAHALGLTHDHYGYWKDSTGKIVARTVNGILTKFQGDVPNHYNANTGDNTLFNYKKSSGGFNNTKVSPHPPAKVSTITPTNAANKEKQQLYPSGFDKVFTGITPQQTVQTNKLSPTEGDAANIMFKQDGGSTGSNPGGFYTGKDGVKRYVKFYTEDGQAQGEDLANKILAIMGIAAPNSQVFKYKGSWAFASDVVPGKELQYTPITPELAQKILDGFVGDVLVANADALGAQKGQSYHRNCLVMPNGNPVRIDQGGALLFRGLSGRKPPEWLSDIREWDGFQSIKNPGYKTIFDTAGIDLSDMKQMMQQKMFAFWEVVNNNGGINHWVKMTAPNMSPADQKAVGQMLFNRSNQIYNKLEQL